MASAQTRTIVLVHTTPQHRDGCDPAINLAAEGVSALLAAYQRTRSDADRAALPLKPGAQCAEFDIARLSQSVLRFAREGRSPAEQAQRAVLAGCHVYRDASGHEHRARTTSDNGMTWASDEWLDKIGDEFGAQAIDEIGHAVIQWTMAPRGALAPFGWAPGLVLAR